MSLYKQAQDLYIQKKYPEAIDLYERSISANENVLDCFINLSFLYWHSNAEFGWAFEYNIPMETRRRGDTRYKELNLTGISQFPEHIEPKFW